MSSLEKNMLAIDIGAGSGRFVLGQWSRGELSLTEIGRFQHSDCIINGMIYWNLPEIYNHVLTGIRKARACVPHLDSIGIDTFSPDFACFSSDGQLLGNMLSYNNFQDARFLESITRSVSPQEFWEICGNGLMPFCLLPQLMYLQEQEIYSHKQDICVLPLGNALEYLLCGVAHTDFTQVSTSMLNDRFSGGWNDALVEQFVRKPFRLPQILPCATALGKLRIDGTKTETLVINVGSHDTACANSLIAEAAGSELAINAGTWISVGTLSKLPVVNQQMVSAGLNNYGLPSGENLVCKLFAGMGLVRRLKEYAESANLPCTYEELACAAESSDFRACFDPLDPDIFSKEYPFSDIVRGIMRRQGLPVPDRFVDVARCVYESLIASINNIADKVALSTDRRFQKIFLGGGGVQDHFFLRLLEERSGKTVVKMPAESTAIANLYTQLRGLGIDPRDVECPK